jgi:hypothetical protein
MIETKKLADSYFMLLDAYRHYLTLLDTTRRYSMLLDAT